MERSEIRGIRDGLRELGYVEDQTILIEYRFAEAQADRLAAIARRRATSAIACATISSRRIQAGRQHAARRRINGERFDIPALFGCRESLGSSRHGGPRCAD